MCDQNTTTLKVLIINITLLTSETGGRIISVLKVSLTEAPVM